MIYIYRRTKKGKQILQLKFVDHPHLDFFTLPLIFQSTPVCTLILVMDNPPP